MARMNDIKINVGDMDIKVDPFLTDTRLLECKMINCKFYSEDSYNCNLKRITLDKDGVCLNREDKNI